MEGVLKVLSSLAVCILCTIWLNHGDETANQNEAMGQLTVFAMFCFSGLCDVLTQSCQKFIFPHLDYMVMMFCFNVQSIILAYHTEIKDSWMAVADAYAMVAATVVAVAILLEFRYPNSYWCSLLRAYGTVVLGTWLIHMVLYYSSVISVGVFDTDLNTTAQGVNVSRTIGAKLSGSYPDYHDLGDKVWVPLFFAWHCAGVLIVLTVLWLVTIACASRNYCMCVPGEEDGVSHFENRVHFDYHVISRMTDSDIE